MTDDHEPHVPADAPTESVATGVRRIRTRDRVAELLDELRPGQRLVVVGGGILGSELVSGAVAAGVTCALVDPDPTPLSDVLGPDLAAVLMTRHRAHGVATVRGALTGVRPDPDTPDRLIAEAGPKLLPADLVALTDGTRLSDEEQRELHAYGVTFKVLGEVTGPDETLVRIIAGEARHTFRLRDDRLVGAVTSDATEAEIAALRRLIEDAAPVNRDALCRPEIGLEDMVS